MGKIPKIKKKGELCADRMAPELACPLGLLRMLPPVCISAGHGRKQIELGTRDTPPPMIVHLASVTLNLKRIIVVWR